ncbi:hypothetical protein PoB_006491700 [Plakobranchus ocellatus]|uniref:Uncharacterized protein n=1 Tax=Plakobranchus ocellatus TaxID=259542 RepID=A0AAV4D2L3_9GAST|nr:hypothetical protein PoB_006491700 [Plakobranchus ocellatus]
MPLVVAEYNSDMYSSLAYSERCLTVIEVFMNMACLQQDDLKLSGASSGQSVGNNIRTGDRMDLADLKADSLFRVSPTSPAAVECLELVIDSTTIARKEGISFK